MTDANWVLAIRERVPGRELLSQAVAFDSLWAPLGISHATFDGFVDLLAFEYQLDVGRLRPDDPLAVLLDPVPATSWFSRSINEVRAGDRQLVLQNFLEQSCRAHGLLPSRAPTTLGEYLQACDGVLAS